MITHCKCITSRKEWGSCCHLAQFALLWSLLGGLEHSLLYKYFVCFVMVLKAWNKKKYDSCLNWMKFSHPIFIFNPAHSKEVEILRGMLVLFSFGFNKTENANNTVAQLFLKRFEHDWVYLFSSCSWRWKVFALFSSRLKSSMEAKRLSINILNGPEETDMTVLEVTPMVTSSNNKRHWRWWSCKSWQNRMQSRKPMKSRRQ